MSQVGSGRTVPPTRHANYRRCLDQMLRNFLKGLSLRLRG